MKTLRHMATRTVLPPWSREQRVARSKGSKSSSGNDALVQGNALQEQQIGRHIEELIQLGIGRNRQDRLETERDVGDFHRDKPKQEKRPRSRDNASTELIDGACQK